MPIPLLILGGVAVAGGITYLDGRVRLKTAENIYQRHRKKYETAVKHFEDKTEDVKERLDLLGKRRLESLERLNSAVEFLRKAKVRDRDLEQLFDITPETITTWEAGPAKVTEVVDGIAKSIGSGVATALGAYGLVGAYGAASTGAAISSLSGAAATNATLAWLGGGALAAGGGGMFIGTMVLGGLFVAPSTLVAGIMKSAKASKLESEFEKLKSKMKVYQAKMDQQIAVFNVAIDRIEEIQVSTLEIDKALQDLLIKSNPRSLEDAYDVARTAKTLGKLIDIPITDKNGNLITD